MRTVTLVLLGMLLSLNVWAGEVAIKHVTFIDQTGSWRVNVTLKHADEGWNHYADGWRIVDVKGNELAHRTLHHPHVEEQPFTRGMSKVHIPAKTKIVYIEAHDKVHGWSKDRLKVDLSKSQGERYKITR